MTKFDEMVCDNICDNITAEMLLFAADHSWEDDYYSRTSRCMPTVDIYTAFFEALVSTPQKHRPIQSWIADPAVLCRVRKALKAPDVEDLWAEYVHKYRQLCRIKDSCREENQWEALAAMLALPPEELRWHVNHATLEWSTVYRAIHIIAHSSFEGLCETYKTGGLY